MPYWRQFFQVLSSLKKSRRQLEENPLPVRIREAMSRQEEAGQEVRNVIKELLEKVDRLDEENAKLRRNRKRNPDARPLV